VALFKNNEGRPFFRAGFTGFFHGLFKQVSNPGSVTGDFKTGNVRGSFKVAMVAGDCKNINVHGSFKTGKVEGDFVTAQLHGKVKILVESPY